MIASQSMQNQQEHFDLIVVGGGIIGLASAFKIQKRYPSLRILVLEKENELAPHQTGRNSGVIHSGLYYKPGSYKAKTCVGGSKELIAFARENKIAHEVCGKIVVATNETEIPYLQSLFQRGIENKVEGIELIDPGQIREIEPFCAGVAGMWVPATGIIDFPGVTRKLAEMIPLINPQSKVLTGQKVKGESREGGRRIVHTTSNSFSTRYIVFCAGLHADRMAKMENHSKLGMRIVGFRGDYYELTEKGLHKVRNLIYPVPNPAFPFLGVHFTRMVHGGVECGPNAVFTFKREGYGKLSFNFRDSWDALTYKGTWKLLFKNKKFGWDEYRRAFSKKQFLKQVRKLIPSLKMDEMEPGRSGVRAMALDPDGQMIDDFKIEYMEQSIHVLNAPSPAATSSLAIGEEVCSMAAKHFQLSEAVSEAV